MSRVYGYVRVSTTDQADSGAGLAAQRAAIQQEADRRGWSVTWVEDGGFSGGSLNRPGIAGLLPRLRRGDVLVVSKLDRLSRSLVDAVGLMDASQKRGWSLVALDLGVDTGTPTGRLVASVMAAVASWERDVIGERTRDAMAAKKAAGTRFGCPSQHPPALLDRIETEHQAGHTLADIARDLTTDEVPTAEGCRRWWPSTVQSALRSRANDRLADARCRPVGEGVRRR